MEGRHYSVAQQRAQEVLSHQTPISTENVYYVLSALPQPKNTRRIGVIPDGQLFVHSQAAGLTTQHGARPTLSSICLKCPLVVTVLSKFVLDYDPTFTFTTITINYNYASAPHQDVNHEDGRARIIALGDFEGGELNIDGIGDINIRNNWYDFDGTILHSTKPFVGERYSLVYFTHLSWKLEGGEDVGRRLICLGVPWPANVASLPSPLVTLYGSGGEKNISSQSLNNFNSYYFLPLKKKHQYESAICSEISSLCSLCFDTPQTSSNYRLFPPLRALYENIHEDMNSIYSYQLTIDENVSTSSLQFIANRAVTFTVWRRICSSKTLELLFQAQLDVGWFTPHKFGIEIYSSGKQMSTRQKRKVLLLAQLARSGHSNSNDPTHEQTQEEQTQEEQTQNQNSYVQLCLILEYDWTGKDEDGSQGILSHVHLCEKISPILEKIERGKKSSTKGTNSADLANPKRDESESDGPLDHAPASPSLTPSTALRPLLSQLLCNLAKIQNNSLVYDPFCGSGSILRVVNELGGYAIGSDAFERHLIPFTSTSTSISTQHRSENYFVSNIYHQQINGSGQFDAIVCDPPYGRREKHVDEKGVDSANHQTNEERAISQFKILKPLIQLSSTALRIGGRLVFLFLNFPKSDKVRWNPLIDLPLQNNMRVLHTWSEVWESSSGYIISRDTVVLERFY